MAPYELLFQAHNYPTQESFKSILGMSRKPPDFILNEGVNGKIQNYRYLRVFVVFVLTDADERSQ